MKASKNVEELVALPALHCHPLTGDRDGQWAVSLNGQVRLIFCFLDDEMKIIRIEEVTDYHDG